MVGRKGCGYARAREHVCERVGGGWIKNEPAESAVEKEREGASKQSALPAVVKPGLAPADTCLRAHRRARDRLLLIGKLILKRMDFPRYQRMTPFCCHNEARTLTPARQARALRRHILLAKSLWLRDRSAQARLGRMMTGISYFWGLLRLAVLGQQSLRTGKAPGRWGGREVSGCP